MIITDMKAIYPVTSSLSHLSFTPGMNRMAQTAKAAGNLPHELTGEM
jgi:hypothetical protein